jgi:hypothetical protein
MYMRQTLAAEDARERGSRGGGGGHRGYSVGRSLSKERAHS